MDRWLGIGGFVIGVVGLVLTIYYARKAEQLNLAKKRLDWADLQNAANDLGRQIRREFPPSAIVTPGLAGATFGNLLATEFQNQPPVFVGTRTWREDPHNPVKSDGSFYFTTSKWIVTIPKAVLNYKDGNILIIDDFVMSGDFLAKLRERLIESGVPADRIRAASVAVTRVACKNHKAPEYYWWLADNDDFYFPWGRAK